MRVGSLPFHEHGRGRDARMHAFTPRSSPSTDQNHFFKNR